MINKKNIKRCIASGVLGATILTGIGLTIKDAKTDHTEELCPITKILNIINPEDSAPLGIELHQIPAMQKDYKEKGMGNVAISYVHYYEEHIETVYAKSIGKKIIDGEMVYVFPDGYTLYLEGRKPMGKKDIPVTEIHHDLVGDTPYAKRLKID